MSSADDRIERVARAICGRDLEWRDCESACLTAGKCVGNLSECVIDLARAAIAAAQSDGVWQPIETAPKDGTRILFALPYVWCGYWRCERPVGMPDYRWDETWIGWTREAFEDRPLNPTHWMPLPDPPAFSAPEPVEEQG